MNFSWDINIGHIVMVVVPLLGVIVGYVTLRVKAESNDTATKNLGTRVDAYGTALADLRLHVEATCVKKDDLQRVEDRITDRIGTVEHTVRNTSATILAALTNNARPERGTRP
ncbi:hypothetical protein [Methylobacterium flocculans]|uniref:hypothetical protein n=1 Tax=Methylobacterium flocculans TaxID=2984843 RepID=UPI0021F3818E|nr:hypothetical protein [Methylobacterium sp. FF17]